MLQTSVVDVCKRFPLSPAVCIVHSNPSAFKSLTVNGTNHFIGYAFIYFDPAIHFLHINPTKVLFFQVAHIQNKLKETRFVKTVFCTKIYKEPCIVSITGRKISSSSVSTPFASVASVKPVKSSFCSSYTGFS